VESSADVAVIGMGPGGEHAALSLARAGLDVVGIEKHLVGGECPYWGCVPSKMMIRAANLLAEGRRIPGMAGAVTVTPDWSPVARRIREEATDNWDDRVAAERFANAGGRLIRGEGRLAGPGRVVVGDTTLQLRRGVVLNTGTAPAVPPIDGLAGLPYWTNHEAIEATEVPSSLIVLGGGAIGAELSQVFARFGSRVTIVEALERLLPPEEPEASALLARVFGEEEIGVRLSAKVSRVDHNGREFNVSVDGGGDLQAEKLLVATGRRAHLDRLGLDSIGLDPSAHSLPVDEHVRAAPGVWAIGDMTGVGAFTHVSMYQADIAVADILGRPHPPADYRALPRVTFTDPEVGSVGLSEAAARERGLNVRVLTADVPKSARGWIHKAGNDGLIKLVEDRDRGILVGATSAGPCGGEVLGLLVLAVHAEVPAATLRTMMYAYPTFHRAIEAALKD
jgi:pyruvate/2-oxoglutarate dehydrogenase complex dihydrolipoamide dehydrogenase (E3) component